MAALTVDLQLAEIDALIRNNTGLGDTGATYLVGTSGDNAVSIAGEGEAELAGGAMSLGIERAISRQDGFALYRNYAGIPVIGVYRWLPDQNLALLAEISQVEALAPARELAGNIIGIGIVSVGVLLVGVYLLSRNIVRPIEAIGIAAKKLAAGDLGQTVPVTTEDEVGLLAHTFNQMAVQLKTAFEELENRVRERTSELETTLTQLKNTQAQMIHSEKMSSLGQLVAGIAHEINNPASFIHGNLIHAQTYVEDLFAFVKLYEEYYPQPVSAIEERGIAIDWEFLQQDLPKMLASMQTGSERIREIVRSLRNFSRMDESEIKLADIHEGINSTLMILQHRLNAKPGQPAIKTIRDYGELPQVECCPGALNQVFMNILNNAIDAIEEKTERLTPEEVELSPGCIKIRTRTIAEKWIQIAIADNGSGIPNEVLPHIFDPFFTTKAIGKGTGMGMSIGYRIITERHKGKLHCTSSLEKGTEFIIEIPLHQFSNTSNPRLDRANKLV
ncbi:MAG: HAMP domain-containing histidine kinase [Cyanobacteria bacterium SBLK]|nr:HAMP domain-containing histidine kinase [Cyanobacteria bacterium SBLK]